MFEAVFPSLIKKDRRNNNIYSKFKQWTNEIKSSYWKRYDDWINEWMTELLETLNQRELERLKVN